MAIFGKALGNGYAITAVIGKRSIMESAQTSFISSTFWTERIGPTAALKTLDIMEKEESWRYISKLGTSIKANWKKIAENNNVKISVWGLSALPGFTIESKNHLAYKTLITQEMLKKGFLATNIVYVSTAHNEGILKSYFSALDEVFKIISKCELGEDIKNYLKVPICESGFKRLN
jgi:glutamate-1-semialdehyde aminotransferase